MKKKILEILNSPRFWQLGFVGLTTGLHDYSVHHDWAKALSIAFGIWFGSSVAVGTVDRTVDHLSK